MLYAAALHFDFCIPKQCRRIVNDIRCDENACNYLGSDDGSANPRRIRGISRRSTNCRSENSRVLQLRCRGIRRYCAYQSIHSRHACRRILSHYAKSLHQRNQADAYMKPAYAPLFQPFVFRCGLEVENRLAVAPMTTWSSNQNALIHDDEIPYIARRSKGIGM